MWCSHCKSPAINADAAADYWQEQEQQHGVDGGFDGNEEEEEEVFEVCDLSVPSPLTPHLSHLCIFLTHNP